MKIPSHVRHLLSALALFTSSATAAPGSHLEGYSHIEKRAWLSNADVHQACKQQHGSAWCAVAEGSGRSDWKCRNSGSSEKCGVDMIRYCRDRHGSSATAYCGGGMVWDWQFHN